MAFVKNDHYYTNTVCVNDVPANLSIGNPLGDKFVPQVDMVKWDGEAWLKLWYPQAVSTELATYDAENDRISLTIGNFTFRWYLHQDESLEYEIEMAANPGGAQNVFVLNLDFPTGMKFAYQPALTQAEIDEGCIRPDNVVGSYAVYWNKSGNHYRTGKFCHIYRPKLIDALGVESWCTQVIDPVAKTLTITGNKTWLKNATYPVILDPNVGYQSTGGSSFTTDSLGICMVKDENGAYYATGVGAGILQSVSVYLAKEGALDWDKAIDIGVYDLDGTTPNNLIDNATKSSSFIQDNWNTVNMPDSVDLADSTSYFPAVAAGAGSGGFKYDNDADCVCVYATSTTTLPDPNAWSSTLTRLVSIYFTYAAAAGGETHTQTTDVDALLKRVGSIKTSQIDALLKNLSNTNLINIDAFLKDIIQTDVNIDAFLKNLSNTNLINIDAILKSINLETINIDGFLKSLGRSQYINLDAILAAGIPATISIDAFLKALNQSVTNIDALLQKLNSETLSLDAILNFTNLSTVSIDGIIKLIGSNNINIDALLKALNQSKSTFLDAILISDIFTSVNIDAILSNLLQIDISIDAVLKAALRTTTNINAILIAITLPFIQFINKDRGTSFTEIGRGTSFSKSRTTSLVIKDRRKL